MKKFFKFLFKLLGKLVVIALVFFVVTFGLYMTNGENKLIYYVIPLFFCGGGSALHVQSIGIAVYYLRLREHWINIAGFFALRQWVRCHFPGIVPAGYFRWWRCIKKTSPGSVRSGDFAPVFSSRTDEACIPCHPKRWRPSIDGFGDASDRISFSGPVAHPDRALAF